MSPSVKPKNPKGSKASRVKKAGHPTFRAWFTAQGWEPKSFQEEVWAAYGRGESGLIHVATGAGKTLAALGGPLSAMVSEWEAAEDGQDGNGSGVEGLQILYITPLRALSRDIGKAMVRPIEDLALPFTVESRTGDTKASVRARQQKRLPHILITTPESLTLLMTQPNARERFARLRCVILDEWHELLSSKRGILMELAMARLRRWTRELGPRRVPCQVWAISATLANTAEAAQVAVGPSGTPTVVTAPVERPVVMDTLLPPEVDSFPWAGHLGTVMTDALVSALDPDQSTLIFTNTRNQAERWYFEILAARPEWAGLIALHHGSLDPEVRAFVEGALKDGRLRIVVCTSSLDLGVDFAPVERVFQVGSPKGIARLLQRAGRSGHRPGATCRITMVPTHAMELLEMAAVQEAVEQQAVEPRMPLEKPFDVLAQHMVSVALGQGFLPDDLYEEVVDTVAYQYLAWEEFGWVLDFVRDGGALHAYPEYHKIEWVEEEGYRVPDKRIAQLHRMNIGTITSSSAVVVQFLKGAKLGTVEESFVSRMRAGDRFMFAGRVLEFVRLEETTAYVRQAKRKTRMVPRWAGGRMPLSTELSRCLREVLSALGEGEAPWADHPMVERYPEVAAALPILVAQQGLSVLPKTGELLVETCKTRDGYHGFLYPFEGRLVHEGLATLLGVRMAQGEPVSFSMSVNDYGIEWLCPEPFPFADRLTPALFSTDHLLEDILESLNVGELARRQFRDIARVAGLVYQSYPGRRKTSRQLLSSTHLLYEVFEEHDGENLLLHQARDEVLTQQLEQNRLVQFLKRLESATLIHREVKRPTPFAFPLVADRLGGRLTTESLQDRIARMKQQWQKWTPV